jgi:AraC-like DNA-binding protein
VRLRPTALASLARYALSAAATYGLEQDALLREAGLSREAVDALDGRVPVAALMRLWQLAALHSGDPDYGLHVAEQLASPQTVHVVGFAARSAATLREAIETALRFTPVMNESTSFELLCGPTTSVLRVGPAAPHPPWPRAYAEVVLGGYRRMGPFFVSQDVACLAATFQHAAPASRQAYERVFGPNLAFEATHNSLTFPSSALALPVRFSDPALYEYFQAEARSHLARLPEASELRQRVRRALGDRLAGAPGVGDLARQLGMSTRSLQRALQSEGVTFDQIRDEVRRELAMGLIEDRRVSVEEIATLLGYADGSAFRAAFRRWSGRSPREARRAS